MDDQSISEINRDPSRRDVEFSKVLYDIWDAKNNIDGIQWRVSNSYYPEAQVNQIENEASELVNEIKNARIRDFEKDATGPWIAVFSTFVSFACILLSLKISTPTPHASVPLYFL